MTKNISPVKLFTAFVYCNWFKKLPMRLKHIVLVIFIMAVILNRFHTFYLLTTLNEVMWPPQNVVEFRSNRLFANSYN